MLYAFPREDAEEPASPSAEARLGVSVGRQVGGAVERNRVKRLIREAFWSLAERSAGRARLRGRRAAGAAELVDAGGPRRRCSGELAELLGRLERRAGRAPAGGGGMRRALATRRAGADPLLPALDLAAAAAALQVRADLLRLCGRGDPDVRAAARESCWPAGACCAATPSATAGYDPVSAQRLFEVRPMTPVFANILQPLIDAVRLRCSRTLHDDVGLSWGLSIVVLTVIVRLAILPLTIKQIKSMNALRALQPQIKEIQEKYKGDRQRMNQEMMRFYKENKVNPFASCLPLLLQLPVFMSLFYLLKGNEFKEQVRGHGRRRLPVHQRHHRAGARRRAGRS